MGAVAGAAVVLWTATPPVIPEKNDNSRPSLVLSWKIMENRSCVDNFFMRMS